MIYCIWLAPDLESAKNWGTLAVFAGTMLAIGRKDQLARSPMSRLEALEKIPPRGVTLFLEGGSKYWHRGPALDTFTDILGQMKAGNSEILSIVRKTIGASNFGLLWQVLRALDTGTDSQQARGNDARKSFERQTKLRGKNRQQKK